MKEEKLFQRIEGEGQLVILLPGFVGSIHFWDDISKSLSKNHKVISLDLLGFGRSPKPKNSSYSLDEHADAVYNTILPFIDGKEFTLVGHSMGALVALHLLAKYNLPVKKLILLNPPFYKDRKEALLNIQKSIYAKYQLIHGRFAKISCNIIRFFNPAFQLIAPFFISYLPRKVVSDFFLHTWESFSRSLSNVIESPRYLEDFNQIKVQTDILYGDNDSLNIEANVKELARFKNVRIIKEKGTHMFPLENPNAVLQLIP